MKIKRLISSVLGLALILLATDHLLNQHDLQRPQRVRKETGLTIPSDARILKTKAHVWSLADRDNYEWLIESPSSWEEWLKTNMTREDSDGISWKQVKQFSEVSPMADESIGKQPLDSVWKSRKRISNGHVETSYFYLAGGKTVGLLETFRP